MSAFAAKLAKRARGLVEVSYGLAGWWIVQRDGDLPFSDVELTGWALSVVNNIAEAGIGLFLFAIARRVSLPDSVFALDGPDAQARQRFLLLGMAMIIAAAMVS